MGHFSYTCQLSGVPITGGTKSVLLPLFPKQSWGYEASMEQLSKYGQGSLISNDGPNLYFNELFFPIFGEYDSYGRLEEIEKDDNTEVLEEFFNLSIENIATVITDGRRDEFEKGGEYCDSVKILDKNNPKHMMLLKTSATWFNRDVYDKLTEKKFVDHYNDLNVGKHGILTALGFEHVGIDKNQSRYNKIYKKGNVTLYSDGDFMSGSLYTITYLKEYCSKYGVDIDDKIMSNGYQAQVYDFILPYVTDIVDFFDSDELKRMLLSDNRYSDSFFLRQYQKLLFKEDSDNASENIDKKYQELINNNLSNFYFHKIKQKGNNFLRKNIVDWFNFKEYFYPTGRFLYPIGTSPQDGDPKMVKILMEASLEVLNEQISEYGED